MGSITVDDIMIAIMAGGRSRRMGIDKLALKLNGRTLLGRTIDLARTTGLRLVVVGRREPEGPADGVEYLEDEEPGAGPLAGLQTALNFAAPSPVLAVAADLPYLSEKAVIWLIDQAREKTEVDGVVVRNQGRLEPLFAIYTQHAQPLAAQLLAESKRSVHGLIEAGEFREIDAPEWVTAALFNVNEPGDWQTVLESPPPE
jgi:molybdopterin-guanine dinucleotide biosynthesis protein A